MSCLRNRLIEKLQVVHLGIDYRLRAARESLFWRSMTDQIKNYVQNRDLHGEPPMMTHRISEYPFQRVNINLGVIKQDGKKLILLVTADSFTDFIKVNFVENTKIA